jgi:hypothetical protein
VWGLGRLLRLGVSIRESTESEEMEGRGGGYWECGGGDREMKVGSSCDTLMVKKFKQTSLFASRV